MELKEWQEEAYQCMCENGNGIIEAVTGTGKSILAYKVIEDNETSKVLVVVPTIVLLKQWKQKLIEFGVCKESEISLIGGGNKEMPKRVTIAVVNSIRHINWNHPSAQFDFVFCDEVHRYASKENIGFLKHGQFGHKFGATATLSRQDEKHTLLIDLIGPVIYTLGVDEAEKGGYVSEFDVTCVASRMTQPELQEYLGINQQVSHNMSFFKSFLEAQAILTRPGQHPLKRQAASLMKSVQDRRKAIASVASKAEETINLIKNNEGKKILIFDEYQESADRIYGRLKSEGYNPVLYHSGITKKEKEENMAKFRSDESNVMVSVKCLDEGVDVPSISIGIIVNGNSQKRQAIQRLGRILRKKANKTAMLYMLYVPFTKDMDYTKKRLQFLEAEDKARWVDKYLPQIMEEIKAEEAGNQYSLYDF